jgi:hypothetical protein
MITAPNTAQIHGLAMCMQHWCTAIEDAEFQAHNPHLSSAARVEAFQLASRAEVRAGRLLKLLRSVETERFMQEAA